MFYYIICRTNWSPAPILGCSSIKKTQHTAGLTEKSTELGSASPKSDHDNIYLYVQVPAPQNLKIYLNPRIFSNKEILFD